MTIVQIVCQRPGLRRAGRAWPATTPRVDWDALSEIQRRQITAEPALIVTPATEPAEDEPATDAAGDGATPGDATETDTEAAPTEPVEDAAAPQQSAGRRRK